MSLIKLFFVFFYIGLITIGGGQVGITVMYQVLVERFGLLNDELFYNMVAIAESTPGPIGINMATYLGTELYGVFGGIITTLGQVSPSLIIITIIARSMEKFRSSKIITAAFTWIKPAASGLILCCAVKIFLLALFVFPPSVRDFQFLETWNNFFKFECIIFYAVAIIILNKTKLHPVFVVALGAVFGILFL